MTVKVRMIAKLDGHKVLNNKTRTKQETPTNNGSNNKQNLQTEPIMGLFENPLFYYIHVMLSISFVTYNTVEIPLMHEYIVRTRKHRSFEQTHLGVRLWPMLWVSIYSCFGACMYYMYIC